MTVNKIAKCKICEKAIKLLHKRYGSASPHLPRGTRTKSFSDSDDGVFFNTCSETGVWFCNECWEQICPECIK